MKITNIAKGAAGSVLAVTALTGCATAGAAPVSDKPVCPSPADLAPKAGTVKPSTPSVVFLGQTGVTLAPTDVTTLVAGSTAIKGHLYVGGLGDGIGAVPPTINTVLEADGDNDTDRTTNINCKTQLVNAAVAKNATLGTTRQVDVFSALQNAQSAFVGNTSKVKHVVLDGWLLSSGVVDLGAPGVLATSDDIRTTINKIAARKLLPDCRGWLVYGITGVNPVTHKVLSSTDFANLREFWIQFFERCGGHLVQWETALSSFPVDSSGLESANTVQIVKPAGRIVATVSDLSFDVGSAVLQPGDDLSKLLTIIPKGTGLVYVDGYTDSTGSVSANKVLSLARAATVCAWLEQHGIAAGRLRPTGHGATSFVKPNDTDANRRANRRVTVTVFTSKR